MAVQERRKKNSERKKGFGPVTLTTEPGSRFAAKLDALLINRSEEGICIEVGKALPLGMAVQVEMQAELQAGTPGELSGKEGRGETRTEQWEGHVCWMNVAGENTYRAGIETRQDTRNTFLAHDSEEDLYELLQVNPKADFDTIQRIFRMLAQRYHPDHKETGDEVRFQKLLGAYQLLSDPEKRAAYDIRWSATRQQQWQVFRRKDEGDGMAAERRKRAKMLEVMYRKRLRSPDSPYVVMRDFEEVLGVEKEHLEFPLWYLREKGLMLRTDNGRFVITVAGVDAAEHEDILEKRELLAIRGEVGSTGRRS